MATSKTPKKLVLTHLEGVKSGSKMSFDFQSGRALLLGRSPESDIQIENDGNDVVSRKHAEILIHAEPTFSMSITDLDSTNGLFVNGKKIQGSMDLLPGDEIQFGKNGPRFGVDVDPRPAQVLSKTRVISVPEIQATREIMVQEADSFTEAAAPVAMEKTGIGKETVERMIQTTQKKNNNTNILLGIGTLLALGVAAFLFFKPAPEVPVGPGSETPTDTGMSTSQIVKAYGDATVRIETGWKLVHSPTGEDIYHMYDEVPVDEEGNKAVVAFYAKLPNGEIEPYCIGGRPNAHSKIILSHGQGTGFVVDPKGFIMTNRHIAEGWQAEYTFPQGAFPGILISVDNYGNPIPNSGSTINEEDVRGFIPSDLKRLGNSPVTPRYIDGRRMYMDVMFPGDDNRWPVTSTNASPRHDVALVKIDYAGTLGTVNLLDEKPEPGAQISLVGYPGMSAKEYVKQSSRDGMNTNPRILEIVNPSTASGNISKLLSGGFDINSKVSTAGEVYELSSIDFTGGASGSPIFNHEGNVIAIYASGRTDIGATLAYAVPIKFGMELLGRKSTAR